AELDRRRRAGLGTRGGLPVGEPVVAQRAFLGDAPALLGTALAGGGGAIGAAIDHAEGAGRHAHPAAVADVVLDDDGAEFRAEQRPGGAYVEAAGMRAVLAHVGGHEPTELWGVGWAQIGGGLGVMRVRIGKEVHS